MKNLFVYLAFFLLSINIVLAQVRYLNAESFTVRDGLSQGMVNCITRDHFGFMWFGTLDVLNRYDGYHVSVFRHDPDDTSSISDNFITAVLEDSENRLWIGTHAGGLNYFDYETERFISFRHAAYDSNTLTDDRILSLHEDAFGAIWVGTKNGLNKMVITEKAATGSLSNRIARPKFADTHQVTIRHVQFGASGKELFSAHEATSTTYSFTPLFFIDAKGLIFIQTEHSYYCIRPSLSSAYTITKTDRLRPAPEEKTKISALISGTHSVNGKEGFLYLMAMNGIAEIDWHTGIVALTKQFTPTYVREPKTNRVIHENGWFVINFRLYQYVQASQQVVEIRSHEADEELLLNHAIVLYIDQSGKRWVGTGGYGVLTFNSIKENFHRVNGSSVHWLHAGASDNIIIKEGDAVYLLKKKMLTHDQSPWFKSSNYFTKIYSRLKGKYLRAAIEETDGTTWLHAQGISRYNPRKNLVETYTDKPIAWPAMYSDNDKQLWYADDSILCTISSATGKETRYPISLKEKVAEFYVETIYRDAQHIVWIGTTAGLIRFDEKQQKWDQYTFHSGTTTSLSSNLVLTICADTDAQYLWIGTNGVGFNRFDKNTGECIRYGIRDGLPNNVIYGILTDNEGNLWMSTNNGISNFHPSSKEFTNYAAEDGLQGNEFNLHAYCKTSDGTLFFGGVNGYNYFDPSRISTNEPMPQVMITAVNNNGHPVDFREKDSPLSVPCYLSKTVVLKFINNTVSFDFSSMLFNAAAHDKYQYWLEGVDKGWVASSINHSSVYSNLQPGKYVFKVKTAGFQHLYTAMNIIVLPPWYRTWWFMILLTLLASAIVYIFYMYNLQYETNRFKDHQRIASDLHDEIGSTLSSIHIYSEVALTKINSKPQETATYLRQISNNVENTIGSLDDIVWALKMKNDRFVDVGNRMRSAAVGLCEAGGYTLHLHFDERLNELKFGKETRKNLFLIYKEAINNVMKYAEGKNLYIDLLSNGNVIALSVRDDGKGFDPQTGNQGNGLSNMRKRAVDLKGKLDIISSEGKGTNVQLTFTYFAGR